MFHCLLVPIISNKNSAVTHKTLPLCDVSSPTPPPTPAPGCFQKLLLTFVSSSLTGFAHVCLCLHLMLLGIHWTSWIYKCMSFYKLGNVEAIISSNMFFWTHSLFLPLLEIKLHICRHFLHYSTGPWHSVHIFPCFSFPFFRLESFYWSSFSFFNSFR